MFFPWPWCRCGRRVEIAIGLEEVGHSLGVPRHKVFWRVTLPSSVRGWRPLLLVFLESATELTQPWS